MSENKWVGRLTALSAALLMLMSCAGCSGSSGENDSSSAVADNGVGMWKPTVSLNDDQKKAAEEAGISEERYCIDNASITKTATDILNVYYEGVSEADHDKCFDCFPAFYKKKVEEENKRYGETNEQYMQSIKDGFTEQYGDDFYIFPTVTSVLQLTDASVEEMNRRLTESFEEDISLDDLYYVYFKQNIRGSKNKSSSALEYYLLVINGRYYIYDDYYETDTGTADAPAETKNNNEAQIYE